MPTMQAGASEILYTLFGIVEHSGRLQGLTYAYALASKKHPYELQNF